MRSSDGGIMWKLENHEGVKYWYEAELIEKLKAECQEAIDTYDKEQFYEDDCDIFKGEAIMANRIMQLIKEK